MIEPGLYVAKKLAIAITVIDVLGDLNGLGTITVFGIVHCENPARWESEISGRPDQYEMVPSDWRRVDL